jgi:hypothetical protein
MWFTVYIKYDFFALSHVHTCLSFNPYSYLQFHGAYMIISKFPMIQTVFKAISEITLKQTGTGMYSTKRFYRNEIQTTVNQTWVFRSDNLKF